MLFLIGATGFTGSLIAKELVEKKIEATLIGSSQSRLEELVSRLQFQGESLCIDSDSLDRLEGLLDDTSIVINCRGPFTFYSKGIARIAALKGCRYIDITGEQSFVAYCHNELASICAESGATIVNSCSFESAIVDWLAYANLDTDKSYEEIHTFYDSKTRPSPGTVLTMKLSHQSDTWECRNHTLESCAPGKKSMPVPFEGYKRHLALFSPYPEVLFFSRRYSVETVASFTILPDIFAASAEVKHQATAQQKIVEAFDKKRDRLRIAAEKSVAPFTVHITAKEKMGKDVTHSLSGIDAYGLTASLALWAASVDNQNVQKGGVFSPAECFDLSTFFNTQEYQTRFKLHYETV